MKRALFCFMVISFFLSLEGYGQAAHVMDSVSFTVTAVGTDIDEKFDYEVDEIDNLIGKTLNLFVVVYDDTSENATVWNNDTGLFQRDGDSRDPSYMTFMSDASYLLGDGLLGLLDVFHFVQPSHPSVRQVYGQYNGTTTYDYVFREKESGFLFDYNPDPDVASPLTVILYDDQGNRAEVWLQGEPIVQSVILNINKGVVIGDDVLVEDDVVINKNSDIGYHVSIYSGTIVNQGVVIGDDVVVGSDVTIDRDTFIGQRVEIDNETVIGVIGVEIGNGSFIGKDCIIGDDVEIGERVVLGRGVTVLSGTKIPDDTVVGKEITISDSQ